MRESDFTSCWGGVMGSMWFWQKEKSTKPRSGTDYPFKNQLIWIDKWKEPETVDYAPELVSIINEITPCEIQGDLIQFLLLDTYRKSYLLLNFIRNLWYEPMPKYTAVFFKSLGPSKKKYSDPLARLTWANIEGCRVPKPTYSPHHCNAMLGWKSMAVRMAKDMKDLKEYPGGLTTEAFLTKQAA